MPKRATLKLMSVAALGLLTRAASAGETAINPFSVVPEGVVAVYDITDLTTPIPDYTPPSSGRTITSDELAEQYTSLIRETLTPEAWTTAGGTEAAMRVAPTQFTVKAPPDTHKQIALLMSKLRESKQYYVHEEYQVVDSNVVRQYYTDAKPQGRVVYLDQKTINAVAGEGRPVVSLSEQTPHNGQNVLWLDGTGLGLPTLTATATLTITADQADFGRYATLFINATATTTASGAAPAFKAFFTNVSGGTAAVPLNDGLTRWLLVKATVQKR